MVATRRTSLRLQEKATTGDCTLPPFMPDDLTPTRARKASGGESASKKSPRTGSASKAKTPPKRSAKNAGDEPVKEEALEVKDELAKELFQDEKKPLGGAAAAAAKQSAGDSEQEASESAESDTAPASTSAATSEAAEDEAQSAAEFTDDDDAVVAATASASTAAPTAQNAGSAPATASTAAVAQGGEDGDENDDEEEEIVMMDSDDSDDDVDENDAKDGKDDDSEAEEEEEEEEDISAYVLMAASGLNLSTSTIAASAPGSSAASARTQLVPDALESGASQHATYFEFQGHAKGAKLVADQRTKEEQATLRSQMHVAAHAQRQRAEHQNKKSAGRKWFDMESQELTADARRDFALLRMRNYLDPKKFYKTSDHSKKLPKHFQLGVVVEGAHEFKSARLTKKERQQTFTDEIMADAGIQTYTKRVFGQIQASRSGQGKKKAKKPRY